MDGIHYLVDSSGRKKAVQIDLARHGALWEDFHDILVADSRKNEPRVSFETVKERLRLRNLRARTAKAPTSKTRARFMQKVESGLKELDAGKGIPHSVVREAQEKVLAGIHHEPERSAAARSGPGPEDRFAIIARSS